MSTFYSSGNTDIKKWALLPSQRVVSVLPVEWKVDFSVFGFYDDFNENSSYYSLRDTDFQKSSARVAIFKSHFPTYMGPQSLNIQEYSWNSLYLLNKVHQSVFVTYPVAKIYNICFLRGNNFLEFFVTFLVAKS